MTQTTLEPKTPVAAPEFSPGRLSKLRRVLPMATTVGVSFGIVALQLAQGILLARLLGPQGRGEYATAVLYSQLLLYVGTFGAIEIVCRYSANDLIDRASLRKSAFFLSLCTGITTTAVVILCATFGLPTEKRYMLPLAALCAVSVLGQHVNLVMSAVDRGAGDFRRYNRIRLLAAAAFPLVLIIWLFVSKTTLTSTCVLLVIATIASTIPCFVGTRDQPRLKAAPGARQLLKEGRPYGVAMLATDLLERLDLLLVLWLTSIVTQGYYNAMIPVVYPLTVIPNTIGMYLFNAGAKEGGGLTVERVRHMLAVSIALQTFTTVAFLILVGPVVRFVYGVEFEPAILFAMWLAPVAAMRGIVQGLESYLKGRGKPMVTLRIRIFAAIAMLVSIAILYPWTEVLAIIQGSIVGQIVCVLGLSWIVYDDARQSHRIDRSRQGDDGTHEVKADSD